MRVSGKPGMPPPPGAPSSNAPGVPADVEQLLTGLINVRSKIKLVVLR